MAVRIRLTRMGASKKAFYRLVAADSEAPRDGKFLDILGYYDPKRNPALVNLHTNKIKHWLQKGATASESVRAILKKQGLLKASETTN